MITKNPVLLCGRSVWDRSFFPSDEFTERVRALHSLMAEQDIGALLVFGNGAHYANLSYLTHFIPKSGWAIAVIPLTGDPTLYFSAGGDRDVPFAKELTWIKDVRHLKNAGNEISLLLKEKYVETKKVGIVDVNLMPNQIYDSLLSSLSGITTVEANPLMRIARARLRPRERSAVMHAASLVSLAKQMMMDVFSGGEPIPRAVLQAELVARKLGAHDVRLLTFGGYGPCLSPFEYSCPTISDRLIAYIAVEFQGYWADLAVTFPVPDSDLAEKARRAMRSMMAAANPGATGGEVARSAVKELGPELAGIALETGLGNGIGLSLGEPPLIEIGGREDLIEGNVLSLKVYVHDDKSAAFLL